MALNNNHGLNPAPAMQMDRRTFVAGAALAGAAAGLGAGVAAADEAPAQQAGGVFGYQCSEDWLGTAPVIDDSQIVETVDADIVVVGGGHAGTQCALAAAQAGANVVVLEAQAEDVYWFFGNDIAAFNGEFMTSHGFGGYDLGEVVQEMVDHGCGRVSPELLRRFVYNSGETFDNAVACAPETSDVFSCDNVNCHVKTAYEKPDASFYPSVYDGSKVWAAGYETSGKSPDYEVVGRDGTTISRVTEIELYCMDAARKLGAQWYFETAGVVLVQDEEGAVTGVIASSPDGYKRFNASRAVCLTAGGFAGNADMVYNLCDDFNELGMRNGRDRSTMAFPLGRDGSGLKMGCWAGGFIESHPRPAMNYLPEYPGPWGANPMLMLNAKGKRFMNEGLSGFVSQIFMRQPHGIIATITDSNYMESVKMGAPDLNGPNWGPASMAQGIMENMQAEMELAVGAGPEGAMVTSCVYIGLEAMLEPMTYRVFAADTLEELLSYLGYEGESLQNALAAIAEYNEMCHAGDDFLYAKDAAEMIAIEQPPFFGSYIVNDGTTDVGLVTLAGLVTDEDMNVLGADYTPIKGLYAAGNCLGHRFGPVYWTPACGASVGMAMTHGRVLGKILTNTFVDERGI